MGYRFLIPWERKKQLIKMEEYLSMVKVVPYLIFSLKC